MENFEAGWAFNATIVTSPALKGTNPWVSAWDMGRSAEPRSSGPGKAGRDGQDLPGAAQREGASMVLCVTNGDPGDDCG